MATQNYELKRGYLAEFDDAFNGIKAFTNDTMTDALAAEYLRRYPSRAIYFARLPGVAEPAPAIVIIPPAKPAEPVVDMAADLISTATEVPKVKKPTKAKK